MIQFWKSWPLVNRRLFWLFSSFAVLAFSFFWISEVQSPKQIIPVQQVQEIAPIAFESHVFRVGSFELSVPAEAIVVFERQEGGLLTPNVIGGYIFLGFLVVGVIGILTIITTLSRFWFFTGIGFFLLIIFSLRLESILLFRLPNYLPAIALSILFLLPVSYFGFFKTSISFSVRLLTFVLLTLLVIFIIHFFSNVTHPFMDMSANAIIPGTVLMFIFILMVAHEPLAALIGVITRGTRQTRSLSHFMIIGTIYLINLAIIYGNRKFIIQWDYIPINIMLFISLSGILGLWGFRQRDPQFEGIIKANPFGVFLYLCIAIIGFGSLGYFFATANDPVIRLAEDAILYSSLGYGIIFMIYIVANFGAMLQKNLQVYKVLYEPPHMPYFTFRLMGLIATFVFFAYSNWRVSLHQAYAGYYNAWGDNYIASDTLNLAEGYYNQSQLYALRNYHAHYALAQLNASKGSTEKTIKEYRLLVDSRPLDLAYLNLSHLTQGRHSLEESMGILWLGLHDFPKNGRLQNELGLAYAALNQKDSALLLIQSAMNSSLAKREASINWLALHAQFKSLAKADSLLLDMDADNPGVKSNALALACVQGASMNVNADPGKDTILSVYQVTTLHNALINQKENPDTALINKTAELARKSNNPYFRDYLISGAAFASYNAGQIGSAVRLLREAAFAGKQEQYFNALGLWSIEQNVPTHSIAYFDEALGQAYQPAFINRAIGLTEAARLPEAIVSWDSLTRSKDSVERHQAKKMLTVLKATTTSTIWSDEEKYLFTRYHIALSNIGEFERVINEIENPEWKVKALLDRSKQFDEADDEDLAYVALEAIKGLPIHDPSLYQEVVHQNLIYLAQQKKWPEIEKALKDQSLFIGKYKPLKLYLATMLSEKDSKKDLTKKNFKWLLEANPFFEDGVVAAIKHLSVDDPKSLKLYSALVSALDLNPEAIKLLKLYAVWSIRLDFDETGQSTMEKLKNVMSREAFLNFLKEYPDLFEVTPPLQSSRGQKPHP